MKYFQHDLLCREDDKVWELFEIHGMVGYAAWWVILEELYKAEDSGFQLEATETYLKRLSRDCRITDYRTLPRILDTFADLGLINSQLWQEHIIYSANVVARGDYYVEKKAKARARKQKERSAKKQKAEELATQIHNEKLGKIADVTRDNQDVTHPSHATSRTNTYTDPYSEAKAEAETYSNSEDLDPPVVPQGDAPTSQTENSENSEEQLGLLETEQPVIPDQPSEEAKGSGEKRKGKSSGRAPAKEINKKDFERLRLVYNQFKPELWPECEKGNDKRMGYANRLYQDCDRDIAQCEAVLQVALEYAQTSPWWSGQDGRYTGGGFGTVFMKRRYQEFAEARAMQQRNKASPSPAATAANSDAMRLYLNTLRAIGAA